jgi:hypothetical protein
MSSILKALKKLEHDTTVRKPDAFRINTDILRGNAPRRQISTGLIVTAIAIFACGAGASYLYMRDDSRLLPHQPGLPTMQQQNKSVSPGGAQPQPEPISTVPSDTAEYLSNKPTPPIPESEKTDVSHRNVKYIDHQQSKPIEAIRQPQPQLPEQKPTPTAIPVVPVVPAAKPVIKVHGIAFQDGADSAAVVNGITVSVGSMIEGTKVEEIQKDRVRFNRGGETFDIILDKSN